MKKSRFILITITILTIISLGLPFSSATLGTGRLYVYYSSDYTTLVNQDEHNFYEVLPGQTVYIQIAGIEEFDVGDNITVKICWTHTKFIHNVTVKTLTSGLGNGEVGVGDAANPIPWTVGDFDDGFFEIPPCNTITVHYRDGPPEYVTFFWDAKGRITTAHIHVVPENLLGTLGTISALFLGLYLYTRKEKIPFLKSFK